MPRPPLAALAALAIVAGCGNSDNSTPVACLEGPAFYLQEGSSDVRISECLAENQASGALVEVGAAMLSAATRLNAEARARPGGAANVQLGYLLGAARRGAARSDGIHAELVRRLSAAARYSPESQRLPRAFLRAYRRGYDAGFERG